MTGTTPTSTQTPLVLDELLKKISEKGLEGLSKREKRQLEELSR